MIVAFANQKGGVGKTTTCITLAHLMSLEGEEVSVLDLDAPSELREAGASSTYRRAKSLGIQPYTYDNLASDIQGHLLIDCPPDLANEGAKEAVDNAALVVIPTSTSYEDFEVTLPFVETLSRPFKILLTRIHPNQSVDGVISSLRKSGYDTFGHTVTRYSIYEETTPGDDAKISELLKQGRRKPRFAAVSAVNTVEGRRATKDYLGVLHELKRTLKEMA